jgi:hypothetical protein
MKFFHVIVLAAIGSWAYTASIQDRSGVSSHVSGKTIPLVEHSATALDHNQLPLEYVSAEGVPAIGTVPVSQPTSVPESAGAIVVALIGYALMLRRRSA